MIQYFRKEDDMKIFKFMFLMIIIPVYSWAANSLVTIDDISKMKKAGVSQELINYLTTHQTCSIDANTIIRYHEEGLKAPVILKLIQADEYRPDRESTVEKEFKIIEGLKQAGFSDEAILEYLNSVRTNQLVDINGDRTYRLMPPMESGEKSHKKRVHKKFETPLPYPTTIEVNP